MSVSSRLLPRLASRPVSPFQLLCRNHRICVQVSFAGPLRSPASRSSSSFTSTKSGASRKFANAPIYWLAFGVLSTGSLVYQKEPAHAEEPSQSTTGRVFRLAEVQQHDETSDAHWVYHGDRVYDITDWVPNHPGGNVILRAAGSSIEPYWKIFSIHHSQDVYDILEQYYIGNIDPRDLVDGKPPTSSIEDPFKADPARDPALIVHTQKPCNAETPAGELVNFITPTDKFYVRHHLWVPQVADPTTYRLTIELPDGEEVTYSLEELRTKFKQHTITATMQCSGNRRSHMTERARHTLGLQWGVGGISNAEWTGVRLRDVLADSGLDLANVSEDIKHVQFTGSEAYGASISIEKASDRYGDVLLVHMMNGKDLTPDHGYPLRVVVPGHVAARSVKWLQRIALTEDESTSQWQRRDYKCFGPNVRKDPDWDSAPAIQEFPVQSAIVSQRRMSADQLQNSDLAQRYGVKGDAVIFEGYALSGGGRRIVRVDFSPDDGQSWTQAVLEPHDDKGSKAWSWQQWRIAVPASQLRGHCCVKAVDDSYNTQPESYAPYWNFRGNLTNGWHRVPVQET